MATVQIYISRDGAPLSGQSNPLANPRDNVLLTVDTGQRVYSREDVQEFLSRLIDFLVDGGVNRAQLPQP